MFRTQGCSKHSHPELTFQFAVRVPIPGLERVLLDYFEGEVARGVRFAPGQKIDIGGSLLRLFEREDGTLGVRDVGADGEDVEPESVHRSLMRTWLRQEVARSFGLPVEFPATDATAILCKNIDNSVGAILMKRASPMPDSRDSGWFVGCTDETHGHDEAEQLFVTHLLEVAERFPWLDQFFALPEETLLVVEMGERVKVPALWHREELVAPLPGSYVASINAGPR